VHIRRIVSGFILGLIVVGALLLGGAGYAALVLAASLVAGYELYGMMAGAGFRPLTPLGLALIFFLILDAYAPAQSLLRPSLVAAMMLALVWLLGRDDLKGALTDWALTIAGAVYLGGLASHFILLRALPRGLEWSVVMFASTWANDVGAFYIGTFFGQRRFFPRLSPRKSWEGAVAGIVAGMIGTGVAGALLFGLPIYHLLLLGVALALGTIAGDLAESLLKRQTGVKDSGALIPGHGGMLDRMDSLLFCTTITYYYAAWMLGFG